MIQLRATIQDPADTRAYECLLPVDTPVQQHALRLADILQFPLVSPDNYPIRYGLVMKNGTLLDPDAVLSDMALPEPLVMRLVPEVAAAGDGVRVEEQASAAVKMNGCGEHVGVEVVRVRSLLANIGQNLRMDVRMDAAVHREIERFAAQDRTMECAGLLLGEVSVENGQRVAHIKAVAPASKAEGAKVRVKLTLQAWEEMLAVRDREYASLRVLGWFHTHAGWGIFLSDADVFIHRSFFREPSMTAFVLDPTSGHDSFFYWRGDKIALVPSYGLVGTRDEVFYGKIAKKSRTSRRLGIRHGIIAILAAGVVYLAVANPLASLIRPAKPEKPVQVQQSVPAVNKTAPTDVYTVYRLVEGETLWSVCNHVYADGSLAEALAEYNGLGDYTCLQVGQKIKLPSKEILTANRRSSTAD